MPDTTEVSVNDAGWTSVEQGVAGIISNNGDGDILLREAASDPTASVKVGHPLHPGTSTNYGLDTGQQIWARSVHSFAEVTVTGV